MFVEKKFKKKQTPRFSIKAFFRAYLGALQAKALFFHYPIMPGDRSKETSDFLQCLEKNSRIAGYKFLVTENKVQIFLSHDLTYGKPLIPKVTYYSSQGRTKMATVKLLKQFQKQHPTALTLIRTQFGLLDLKDCLSYQCGGEFLLSLT